MAVVEQKLEKVLEEARDTLDRNKAAKKSAKVREQGLRRVVRQSDRTLDSVNRRLRDAGLQRAAES
jgi:hypothetical protein